MADSTPPFSINNILETLKQTTEAIAGFVQTVAGWIRDKKWVELISLILATIILAWVSRAAIAKFLGEQNSQWFFWICLVVGIMFTVAVVVAVVVKPSLSNAAQNPVERQAIKGLLSFTSQDAEIFSKLQRHQDIKNCLRILNNANFRVGILWGESGCGKTSFLQAGLIPQLEGAQGIYIQFTDKDPLITVKKALNKELNLNLSSAEIEKLDLIAVLNQSIATVQKPLILFFDQFEQFFVHYQSADARRPFIDALNNWYGNEEIAVKILMSFRSDLFYQQHELQQVLNYSLDSRNSIKLKKFSVEQATNVLEEIAKAENIEFDRRDIETFVEQELVDRGKDKSDEPISPVDIQILSLVISDQKTTKVRKFDKDALNKIGRFAGLLYQYLEGLLSLREQSATSAQKETVMKLLLELIDSNGLTRAGAFTLAQLQDKLKPIGAKDIQDAVRWLEQERLIMPLQQEEETAYQLAHERMIPAVLKLSGKILPKADKANELLNKQVKIWIDSNQNPRYLLGWRELWLIEQQKSYLMWGDRQKQKEKLIHKSKQRIYRNFGIVGFIAVLVIGIWGWLNYTIPGQLTQIRWQLTNASEQINNPQHQVKAVSAFAKDQNFPQALKLANKITESSNKASALSAIAETIGKLNNPQKAAELLQTALDSANKITDFSYKASALSAIAETIGKLNNPQKAAELLQTALNSANNITDFSYKASALSAIAETIGKLNNPQKAAELLQTALNSANKITESSYKVYALSAIAEAYSKLNNPQKAAELLQTALNSANKITESSYKVYALSAIAEAYSKLNNPQKAAELLQTALNSANKITESSYKVYALSAIAEAYSKLNNPQKAAELLQTALDSANKITESYSQAYALSAIVAAIGKLNNPQKAAELLQTALNSANKITESYSQADVLSAIVAAIGKLNNPQKAAELLQTALNSANKITDFSDKASVLSAIAAAYSKLNNQQKAAELLQTALKSANNITDFSDKASVLSAIAAAYSKLNNQQKAAELLQSALDSANNITDSSSKASALSAIAAAQANLKNWGQALKVVEGCKQYKDCEVDSLAGVLTIYAEQQHPQLKEKTEE
ncbi:tetratricopeptide repeat protein [Aulosira sp. FACHB-615]|uniref:tetratricopeptide repeat protein n=1 Tax=Aulosira sp. FACHB-615 TaxID=2692777 RepID=UPI00168357EF|nr:tetratricopeptide repeat protein [Aulosira sp. FACHB-615]MBD2486780.1 tetratricopeptide repeat protein [Aulosira sp. FACHB-615]